MTAITGTVYDPPRADLPYVVVIFAPDGEVLEARRAPSLAHGEKFLLNFMAQISKDIGQPMLRG
jgi:hypothetical protein